jgi:hypothetical protein
MQISLIPIIICATIAMVVGFIWFGPLFGKRWAHLIGTTAHHKGKHKQMLSLYGLQFLLVLFQAYILAQYITGWQTISGVGHALWMWAAFVMPTIAGSVMWNNDTRKNAWSRFLIQAGYQLIIFILFGLVLG